MDVGGFQNNVSNTERVCTSVPLSVDVGQTTPDASIVVPGELPSINIQENELRVLNTQPPTLSGEISILQCDSASGSFNPGSLSVELAHVQHSSVNASMCLAVQSRLPVQCTSPNPSLDRAPDTLIMQVQPSAQSCIETMLTPASADQVFSQQGQLLFLASADPACTSNSQNHVGLFQGENQGHTGLLQQRNCSQPGNPMVSFPGFLHSKKPKNSVPNPREMAEQGFTYLGDGIFECQNCSEKLSSQQSPGTSDILRSHHHLCQRQYHTQRYENYCHGPQEQMPPKKPELADEYGQKYFLHGPVKRPDYAEYIKRFNSFLMMPSSVPKTPKELASAGFYFLRQPDQVACFCCGLGFGKWEPHDDPCKEHAFKSPNCSFVRQVLGSQSVQQQPVNGTSASIQTRPLATNGSSASIMTGNLATNGSSASIHTRPLATNGSSASIQTRPLATNGSSASIQTRTLATNGSSASIMTGSLARNGSSASIMTGSLATNGNSASIQTRTLTTNGSSASIQTRTLATNISIDNCQELPIDSISHDVSNMSLDANPSMPRGFSYQAITDMGIQPDQIKRAIANLQGKKRMGIIDTYSIVNEILEMDETKVTPRCFQCHQEMRDGYALLPCGHVAICLNCDVTQIRVCPFCKKKVDGCVVTYFPTRH